MDIGRSQVGWAERSLVVGIQRLRVAWEVDQRVEEGLGLRSQSMIVRDEDVSLMGGMPRDW